PVPVADIVRDALAAFDAATLSCKTEVAVEVTDDLLVRGDRPALAQMLVNLLTNAWKYTPPTDKRIAIRAIVSGERRVELAVIDNGPGIPKVEQQKIFEKFERGQDAIDGRTHGVGLGLATVRAIVRGHKGRVELRSRFGEGTEFRVLLPRATESAPA
ncbi:MAG: HAMP domain-containing sensor histidine kinase, partial [Myxococcota bacterium]